MSSIYMDNAATSFPKAPGVAEAMLHYINNVGANVGRGSYQSATEAETKLMDLRGMLCSFFDFPLPSHVIFTGGLTAALNCVIKGSRKNGSHIIVSSFEHNAVMRPIVQCGFEYDAIPADSNGVSITSELEALIRPDTTLCVVSQASNVSGVIQPVKEISCILNKHNIPLVLDAAQSAGHIPIDFMDLGLSALCIPFHKGILGPQGVGAMLLTREFAQSIEPLIAGGTGSFSDSLIVPTAMPDRFEAGTLNIPGLYGAAAAMEYINSVGADAMRSHELELISLFLEGIKGIPSVRLLGQADKQLRVGVFTLDFLNRDNAEAAFELEERFGIQTRCGLHCAPTAHKELNSYPNGGVRFSFSYETTHRDIIYTLSAIARIS